MDSLRIHVHNGMYAFFYGEMSNFLLKTCEIPQV